MALAHIFLALCRHKDRRSGTSYLPTSCGARRPPRSVHEI